jgi:hypothetical protein
MARCPPGVAIRVSGDAHAHNGAQPWGHVPWVLGLTHSGPKEIGPWGSQQISPVPQHLLPQQRFFSAQVAEQGLGMQ